MSRIAWLVIELRAAERWLCAGYLVREMGQCRRLGTAPSANGLWAYIGSIAPAWMTGNHLMSDCKR
jgi:hypothetical protein